MIVLAIQRLRWLPCFGIFSKLRATNSSAYCAFSQKTRDPSRAQIPLFTIMFAIPTSQKETKCNYASMPDCHWKNMFTEPSVVQIASSLTIEQRLFPHMKGIQ